MMQAISLSAADLPARNDMWLARFLDHRIDQVARANSPMIVTRCTVLLLVGGVLIANLGWRVGAVWLLVGVIAETWCNRLKSRLHNNGTQRWRLTYVVMTACLSAVWTTVPVLFWLSQVRALQIYGVIVLATQLIHAQAFTFRAPAVLTFTLGIPAAALVVMTMVFGGFTGLHLATVSAGILLSLTYIGVTVKANLIHARNYDKTQEKLVELAYFDALTSLANRRMFTEDFHRLIDTSKRCQSRFTLLLLDLDRFKHTNDTLGHDAGDALLVEVGARLSQSIREGDRVARLGGDEFAILLPGTWDPEAIDLVCHRITDSFARSVQLNGASVVPSFSAGIAIYPDNGDGQESLLKAADLAMYRAKRNRGLGNKRRTRAEPCHCYAATESEEYDEPPVLALA